MASSTQQDAAVCVWRTASKLEAPTAAAGGASPADRPERDYSATEQHRSFGPPLTGAWLKLAVAAFESPLGGTMFSLAARQPGMAQLLEVRRDHNGHAACSCRCLAARGCRGGQAVSCSAPAAPQRSHAPHVPPRTLPARSCCAWSAWRRCQGAGDVWLLDGTTRAAAATAGDGGAD
jgi:hypothetical protein